MIFPAESFPPAHQRDSLPHKILCECSSFVISFYICTNIRKNHTSFTFQQYPARSDRLKKQGSMEPKKTPKADLQNKRGLFLEIGLVISMALMIGAFAINQRDKVVQVIDNGGIAPEQEIVEITRPEEQPKQEQVKQTIAVVSDILKIVSNDTKITTEMTFDEFGEDIQIAPLEVAEEAVADEEFFVSAEEMPSFQGGGIEAFRNWVLKRFEYPAIAQENGIQGVVVIRFLIEKDGRLTNISVIVTPDRSLSDEVVRVLKTSPKWKPGKHRNSNVRIQYTMPIEFRIQD